jgi:hypothetical protein
LIWDRLSLVYDRLSIILIKKTKSSTDGSIQSVVSITDSIDCWYRYWSFDSSRILPCYDGTQLGPDPSLNRRILYRAKSSATDPYPHGSGVGMHRATSTWMQKTEIHCDWRCLLRTFSRDIPLFLAKFDYFRQTFVIIPWYFIGRKFVLQG